MKKEKIGIVDVGGGFRGIYTAGVLDCGVSTLSRDINDLNQLYQKGYQDGIKITNFLKESNC
ncbi:MAG: hypothetical protein GX328_07890 [Clostridiaceae bacterium]|nr:hypothetical protein [Clostridiaceae bacterium]